MRNDSVLSNHERALLAHQCTLGEKIACFNMSQFYVIKINHRVQKIIDIAEFTPEDLFSSLNHYHSVKIPPFPW